MFFLNRIRNWGKVHIHEEKYEISENNLKNEYESYDDMEDDEDDKTIRLYTTIMRKKLRNKINTTPNEKCNICNSKFDEGIKTLLPCDHGFHHICINIWLKHEQNCPICRTELTNSIPTKQYVKEKYTYDYLINYMIELGIIMDEYDVNYDEDELIEKFINYFVSLATTKSVRRISSNDSITLSDLSES